MWTCIKVLISYLWLFLCGSPPQSLVSTATLSRSAQQGTLPWATTAPQWWAVNWSPAPSSTVRRMRTPAGRWSFTLSPSLCLFSNFPLFISGSLLKSTNPPTFPAPGELPCGWPCAVPQSCMLCVGLGTVTAKVTKFPLSLYNGPIRLHCIVSQMQQLHRAELVFSANAQTQMPPTEAQSGQNRLGGLPLNTGLLHIHVCVWVRKGTKNGYVSMCLTHQVSPSLFSSLRPLAVSQIPLCTIPIRFQYVFERLKSE